MRRILLLFLFAFAISIARADDNVVQEFSGTGSTTTALFKVSGKWQVRWNARQVVSVAVMAQDGTIVTGAAGVLRGSLFVPAAGQYYLKISDGSAPTPPPATTNTAPDPNTPSPTPPTDVSWHLTVVELGATVPAGQELTVYTPFFIVPDSIIAPAAAAPSVSPPTLSDKQLQSLVTIKGDNATGGGFLMRLPDKTIVVTTLHLLAANPNIKVTTNTGNTPVTINTTGFKGAGDRDLAFLTVTDSQSGIPIASNIKSGDQVIVPAFNRRDTTLFGRVGTVVGVGPVQLDLDIHLGSNADGTPVILVKGGSVPAVICNIKRSDLSASIAQAWSANPAPGARPFSALRVAGIKIWEDYDTSRFLAEAAFLKQVHADTRCLDSYLNSHRFRSVEEAEAKPHPTGGDYLDNEKIKSAVETYKHFSVGADQNQRLAAAKELLFDLIGIADTDVSKLNPFSSAYSYNQRWAQEELAYRKGLRKQLDDFSNNIGALDRIARTR